MENSVGPYVHVDTADARCAFFPSLLLMSIAIMTFGGHLRLFCYCNEGHAATLFAPSMVLRINGMWVHELDDATRMPSLQDTFCRA